MRPAKPAQSLKPEHLNHLGPLHKVTGEPGSVSEWLRAPAVPALIKTERKSLAHPLQMTNSALSLTQNAQTWHKLLQQRRSLTIGRRRSCQETDERLHFGLPAHIHLNQTLTFFSSLASFLPGVYPLTNKWSPPEKIKRCKMPFIIHQTLRKTLPPKRCL